MSDHAPDSVVSAASVCLPGGVEPAQIRIEDGRIAAIEAATAPVDAIVAPGFVDLQVNGIDDIDCSDADGSDWARLGALLAPTGVTAWLPTIVSQPLDRYRGCLERIEQARTRRDGPVVLGAHLEGPFLGARPGAHRTEAIVDADLDWLAGLPPTVRLVTIAPEQPEVAAAIDVLVGKGIVVSLGHSGASFDTAISAIDAGARMVTHLFNGMSPLHHRRPGLAGAALADDRVVVGLIADLVHVHPALLATAFRTKGRDAVALVTDAVAWRSVRSGRPALGVVDGAPRLPDGTLAGSSLTMDQAVRNLVDAAGVAPTDAVRAASSTPAALLADPTRGRIAVGARADLVVLGAEDLSVQRTIVAGEATFES